MTYSFKYVALATQIACYFIQEKGEIAQLTSDSEDFQTPLLVKIVSKVRS